MKAHRDHYMWTIMCGPLCVDIGVLLTFEPLEFLERYHKDGWYV